jgi:hypothetical protein
VRGDPVRLRPRQAERFKVILIILEEQQVQTCYCHGDCLGACQPLNAMDSSHLLSTAPVFRFHLSVTASSCGADVAEGPEASIASAPPSRLPIPRAYCKLRGICYTTGLARKTFLVCVALDGRRSKLAGTLSSRLTVTVTVRRSPASGAEV